MFFSIILTTLFLISIKILFSYKESINYWRDRGFQYKTPIPVFGSGLSVLLCKKNIFMLVQDIYQEFPSAKLIGAFILNSPILVVRDLELIKHIMTKDFNYFYQRELSEVDVTEEPLENNLFTVSGDTWKVLRHHFTPLFSSSKLKNMFYLILESCNEFEGYLKKQTNTSMDINVHDLTSRFTIDVIGSCAFGLQMNTLTKERNEFHRMGFKIFETSPLRFLKIILKITYPKLFYKLGLTTVNDGVEEFFMNLVKEIIFLRKSQKERKLRHDFIDLIIEIYDKGSITGDSIEHFPHKEPSKVEIKADIEILTAQVFIFFAAGFETSSTAMSYALFEIAHNVDIQRKLQDEIDETLKKDNGKITYDRLQEMNYLGMVLDETTRKYPVAAITTRKCKTKYKVPGSNLCIDKNVHLYIPIYAIHHDESFYPNPEVFDPERFTEEKKSKRHGYSYLPFGEGPRICIGLRFAKMEILAGLVTILKSFNVEPNERTKMPLKFHNRTMVLSPEEHIWLKFTPRQKKKN